MKNLIIAFAVVLVGIVGAGLYAHRAHADDSHTQMSMLHAAQVDAAISHIKEIEALKQRLNADEEPHLAKLNEIGGIYGFKAEELGKTVGIDFKTGLITRVPPQKQQGEHLEIIPPSKQPKK